MIFHFSKNDYSDMKSFSLNWRFSESQNDVLPKKLLTKIVPLSKDISTRIYLYSMTFLVNYQLDVKKFQQIEFLNYPHKTASVDKWLLSKIPKETKKIIISWDEESCVMTEAEIFCKYWDDFCYPSSDDIVILPDTKDWIIYYFHEDQFQFAVIPGTQDLIKK